MSAVLALLSSLLWGSADFGGGLASRRLPAAVVVAWAQGCAMVVLGVLVLATSAWRGPSGWIGWSVLAGAVGALALTTFYLALASGTMGVVSPIASLGVIGPVAAGLAQGNRPSAVQWGGALLAVVGAFAASGPELAGAMGRRSVVLAVLAGLGFGLALLFLARGAAVNPLMTGFGMRVTSVAGFALAGLARRTWGGVARRDLLLLLVVGVGDSAANVLFGLASRGAMLAVVSVLGALYPVVTVLLARVVLHERLLPVQRYGVAGALAGAALIAAG